MIRLLIVLAVFAAAPGCGGESAAPAQTGSGYEDLVAVFADWREFQKPKPTGRLNVPDYSAAAMAAQHKELSSCQRRLAAIDPSAWPIPQQVDYHIVRAEMSGLDFDHRALRPWANNPAFYVTMFGSESDQPAREAHYAYPSTELWSSTWPLDRPAIGDTARATSSGRSRSSG